MKHLTNKFPTGAEVGLSLLRAKTLQTTLLPDLTL